MNATQRDAIRDWFTAAIGAQAIWAQQDAPRPTYPYGLLQFTAGTTLHQDELVFEQDLLQPAGQEMLPRTSGIRMDTITCSVLSLAEQYTGSGEALVRKAVEHLRRYSTRETLRAAGVAFVRVAGYSNQAEVVKGRWLSRWNVDLIFASLDRPSAADLAAERIGYIDKIKLSSDLTPLADPDLNLDDEVLP